jgi:hypothetical protein
LSGVSVLSGLLFGVTLVRKLFAVHPALLFSPTEYSGNVHEVLIDAAEPKGLQKRSIAKSPNPKRRRSIPSWGPVMTTMQGRRSQNRRGEGRGGLEMIHIVTLTRVPIRPMPAFIEALGASSESWWKVMPNVWLVDTTVDAQELASRLRQHITESDSLLVIGAVEDFGGWFDVETLRWLQLSKRRGDFRRPLSEVPAQVDGR